MSQKRPRIEEVLVGGSGDVGRMVDSSQADDRKLIRLVKERRLLFARNNMPVASYYTQIKNLWDEVAVKMGWSVADVRRKWSHIRNSYSRHLRNEMHGTRTGKGRMVSRWYLADELEFLRDHMATDTRTSPYSGYMPTYLEIDAPEQSSSESVDVKPFISNPWFPMTTPKATKYESTFTSPNHHNDDSSSSQNFSPDENSSYFQFFRGIHSEYLELPAKKQRLFKRMCHGFLHQLLDANEQHENGQDSSFEKEQDDAINLSNHSSVDVDNMINVKVESVHQILPHSP